MIRMDTYSMFPTFSQQINMNQPQDLPQNIYHRYPSICIYIYYIYDCIIWYRKPLIQESETIRVIPQKKTKQLTHPDRRFNADAARGFRGCRGVCAGGSEDMEGFHKWRYPNSWMIYFMENKKHGWFIVVCLFHETFNMITFFEWETMMVGWLIDLHYAYFKTIRLFLSSATTHEESLLGFNLHF